MGASRTPAAARIGASRRTSALNRPRARCQTRTLRSWEAAGAPLPVRGDRDRAHRKRGAGRARVPGCPVAAAHCRTVRSSPPDTSTEPSALRATPETRPLWPARVAPGSPVGEVPDAHRPVQAAGGGQRAVVADGDAGHRLACGPRRPAARVRVASSQMRTTRSEPPPTARRPSRLIASAVVTPGMPLHRPHDAARLPRSHKLRRRAFPADEHGAAVRRGRDAADAQLGHGQAAARSAPDPTVQVRRVGRPGRGQDAAAVRRHRERDRGVGEVLEDADPSRGRARGA